jgi:hypothetical protein
MTTTDTKTAITALRIKLPTAMDHVDTVEGDVDFDYKAWNAGVSTAVREVFPAATEINFDEWTGTYDLGDGNMLVITDRTGYMTEDELLGQQAWDIKIMEEW